METRKPLWRRVSASLILAATVGLLSAEIPALASYRDSFSTSQLPAFSGDCTSAQGTAVLTCPTKADVPTTITTGTSYTVLATDTFVCIKLGTAAPFSVLLPSSPVTGKQIKIKDCGRTASLTNPITITPATGNIDAASNFLMTNTGQGDIVEYDGTQFEVF